MLENALRDAALQYAGRGWRVFPLKPKNKIPLTRNGFKDATVAPSQIEAWWSKWPNANIGIATGRASGLIVIDLDGPDAIAAWQRIVREQSGGVPSMADLAVRTARGIHLYYRLRQGDKIPCSAGQDQEKGVDVRADGGYVAAPPSIHPSGSIYEWTTDTVTPVPA